MLSESLGQVATTQVTSSRTPSLTQGKPAFCLEDKLAAGRICRDEGNFEGHSNDLRWLF